MNNICLMNMRNYQLHGIQLRPGNCMYFSKKRGMTKKTATLDSHSKAKLLHIVAEAGMWSIHIQPHLRTMYLISTRDEVKYRL